jgi:hypothetical protein
VNKKVLISITLILACRLIIANAQRQESVLDRIERSIPDREAGWKLIKDEAYLRNEGDDFPQANLFWSNDVEEVGAYIVIYGKLESAKEVFERDFKDEETERRFRLEGVGDAAYLWRPSKEGEGYVLRFTKANLVVMMSSKSEATVKRCARYIAESIPPPNKGMQPTRK